MDENEFKKLMDEAMATTLLPLIKRIDELSSEQRRAMKTLNEMGYPVKQMNESCDGGLSADQMAAEQGKIWGYMGDYSTPDTTPSGKQMNSEDFDLASAQRELWQTEYSPAPTTKAKKLMNASEDEENALAEAQAEIFGY